MKTFNAIFQFTLLASMLSLLLACSTPDNSTPPAELTDIEKQEAVFERWTLDTGEGVDKSFFNLQPWVRGDKVYTIDTRGVIHQVDARSGDADWEFETGMPSIAGLSGNDNSLLATSREGQLARYDFNNGSLQLRWQRRLLSEIRSPAIVSDEQVLVRSVDGKLTALKHEDGEIMWTVSRRVPALSLTGNSHPLVNGDLVISGFDNGKLVAFDRENGSTVWETTVGSPTGRTEIERLVDLDGQFILKDGVIYVSSFQGNLAAITLNSGQTIWSRKFSSFQSMDADAEAIYLTDDNSHVWSIDRRTGSAFWKQDVLNARKLTAPRLLGERLVVADLEGYVHFLDKVDGRLRSRTQTNGNRYIAPPVVVGSAAIVLDQTGQLTALSLSR